MSSRQGISIREFARRDGCSDMLVRKALKSGELVALPDGSLDPALVGTGWRLSNRRSAANGSSQGANASTDGPVPGETPERAAERIVVEEGHAPHSLAEAERIKENYLAKLRQLEFDLKSGEVVKVADVQRVLAAQCATIRNRLLSIPAEVAPRAAMMADAAQVQAFLQEAVSESLEALVIDLAASADELRQRLQ
ncbi:MAG: hypothetical protein U1E62_05335 [Alsobacter sp.]